MSLAVSPSSTPGTYIISQPASVGSDVLCCEPLMEGRLSLDPSGLYVSGNIEAIKRGIRNRQGISFMSEYVVRQELELGLLKQVPLLDHPGLKRQLYTIFRRDTQFKLSTRLFLEFFRKAAEDNRLLSQL